MKTEVELPSVPSYLIELALGDLEKCEASPEYEIHMGIWHREDGPVCKVCLAGAVMAQTFRLERSREVVDVEDYFDQTTADHLEALDDFRTGFIEDGCDTLGCYGDLPEELREWPTPDYGHDPAGFKSSMRELASRLRAVGL